MEITCAVVGCNSKWTLSSKLWFFRVTVNKKVLPLWQKVVTLNMTPDARICSLHFKEDDIVERGGEKLLKRMVVPSYNIVGRTLEERADGSDDDDNDNLMTVRNTLLISKQNEVNTTVAEIAPLSPSSQMVMTYSTLPRSCANVEYYGPTRSIGTQVRLKTEEEVTLKKRLKVLNQRIKRREEKVSYLQTAFKMIKTNVEGTEMAKKLCCELEKISNNLEINESFSVRKEKGKKESGFRDHNSDDEMDNDEVSNAYDKGSFVEVAHSPNLKRIRKATSCQKNENIPVNLLNYPSLSQMTTRSQRKIRSRPSTKRFDSESNVKIKEVEEVYSVKSNPRKNTLLVDKHKTNRCTYFGPSFTDFTSQFTKLDKPTDNYQNILREQFGLEPPVRDPPRRPQELSKIVSAKVETIESSSQYAEPDCEMPRALASEPATQPVAPEPVRQTVAPEPAWQPAAPEPGWQPIDHTSDLEKYIFKMRSLKDAEVQSAVQDNPEPNVLIAQVPRVKVIAEKFSKFKKNNIELRKLEEKVVCLEYDVFDADAKDPMPFQTMRAFFTIKPKKIKEKVDETIVIPPEVKQNFNIRDADLSQLNKKEIEIIDGKIPENRSILEDFKKVLKRKQAIKNKKKQGTLDLEYLYQMAKRESPPLDEDYSNTNMLSKAELDEIRDLIMKKCTSSVHGIRRRTVKSEVIDSVNSACYISNCLASELMRDVDKDI